MENTNNNFGLQIDVEKVLESKNPALKKIIPRFVLAWLKKIIHQDEINYFLAQYKDLKNTELIAAWLEYIDVKYRVIGAENIPADGRHFFVSNHPLGGLDGVVFINEIAKWHGDIKFPVNDILTYIENLSGIFLPINKHGSQSKEAAKRLEEAYASDSQILYFPAGFCSRKIKGEIKDLQWHKNFITKAIQYKRDVVPAYFSGQNSRFFYNLANLRKTVGIKANIEMLFLADEMFKQKDKERTSVFGEKIPYSVFDKSKTPSEWAGWVKDECYKLAAKIPAK
jgi:1-acyl-sn-glycerol-3-phosphate acyltransferase